MVLKKCVLLNKIAGEKYLIRTFTCMKYNLHFNVQVTTSELEQVNMLCSYFLGPLSSCNIEKKASGPSFFALVRDV